MLLRRDSMFCYFRPEAFALASEFWSLVTIFLSWPPGLWWLVFISASFLDLCLPDLLLNMALSWSKLKCSYSSKCCSDIFEFLIDRDLEIGFTRRMLELECAIVSSFDLDFLLSLSLQSGKQGCYVICAHAQRCQMILKTDERLLRFNQQFLSTQ